MKKADQKKTKIQLSRNHLCLDRNPFFLGILVAGLPFTHNPAIMIQMQTDLSRPMLKKPPTP
eukprot:2007872-Amphidinium_carterae.1